jgi:hypothetical protein
LHGKDAADDAGEALPVGNVGRELFTAALGDRIKLGFAIVVRDAPFGGDPPALLEADKGSVDGP